MSCRAACIPPAHSEARPPLSFSFTLPLPPHGHSHSRSQATAGGVATGAARARGNACPGISWTRIPRITRTHISPRTCRPAAHNGHPNWPGVPAAFLTLSFRKRVRGKCRSRDSVHGWDIGGSAAHGDQPDGRPGVPAAVPVGERAEAGAGARAGLNSGPNIALPFGEGQ